MRFWFVAALACVPLLGQLPEGAPTNDKAWKTYLDAVRLLKEHKTGWAVEAFKKADKQDGGHCLDCQKKILKYAMELGDWKAGELAGQEMVAAAPPGKDAAVAHWQLGEVFFAEGRQRHKDECFTRAHEEAAQALAAYASFPGAVRLDGLALANLGQDQAAKARFEQYVEMKPGDDAERRRVERYLERPELARARMAPPFEVTTADGRSISMDDLQGKVVLLDFWATWCGPCRAALPHIRDVARKFQGQPLVILSVSLDADEGKWREFIARNEMTWPQYLDGGFSGSMSKLFGVEAIPHTFTIDADGVLQEEHIGDASIEGKLKKLLARTRASDAAPAAQ